MRFTTPKYALAGAVALVAAAACSRSDRTDAGRDATQSGAIGEAPADTLSRARTNAAEQTGASSRDNTSNPTGRASEPSMADTDTITSRIHDTTASEPRTTGKEPGSRIRKGAKPMDSTKGR